MLTNAPQISRIIWEIRNQFRLPYDLLILFGRLGRPSGAHVTFQFLPALPRWARLVRPLRGLVACMFRSLHLMMLSSHAILKDCLAHRSEAAWWDKEAED